MTAGRARIFAKELTKGKKKGIIKTRSKTGNGYAKVFVIKITPTLAEGALFFYGNY